MTAVQLLSTYTGAGFGTLFLPRPWLREVASCLILYRPRQQIGHPEKSAQVHPGGRQSHAPFGADTALRPLSWGLTSHSGQIRDPLRTAE